MGTVRLRGSGLLAPRHHMATIACSMPAFVYSRVARKRKFSTLSLRSAVENGSTLSLRSAVENGSFSILNSLCLLYLDNAVHCMVPT